MASFSEAFWRLRSEWADAHKLEADLAKLPAGAPERPGLKDKLRMANDTLANLLASYFGAAYQQLGQTRCSGPRRPQAAEHKYAMR